MSENTRPTIGQIGKYDILAVVGEGATSIVYLAYDPFAKRQVALKQLHPELLNDARRGRLFRHLLMNEASLAGKLVHPHIVQIYDASVSPTDAYVAMEYLSGGTLEVPASTTFIDIPVALLLIGIAIIPTLLRRRFSKAQGYCLLGAYFGYLVYIMAF